jgi:hypothetical protein
VLLQYFISLKSLSTAYISQKHISAHSAIKQLTDYFLLLNIDTFRYITLDQSHTHTQLVHVKTRKKEGSNTQKMNSTALIALCSTTMLCQQQQQLRIASAVLLYRHKNKPLWPVERSVLSGFSRGKDALLSLSRFGVAKFIIFCEFLFVISLACTTD